jgi:hypothetical protein
MQQLLRDLDHLRRRTRVMLVAQRLAVLIAWSLGVILGCVLLDFALRLPAALRLLLLLGGLGGLAVAVWRYFVPVFGYRPSLTQIALRVEQVLPALAGRLASSVEFAVSGMDQRNPLAARSIRETQSRLAGESVSRIVQSTRTLRDVGVMFILGSLVLTLALVAPAGAQTGLARLFAPFGTAAWPARTAVASLMHEVVVHENVYPRGEAMPLRARNLTPDDPDGRVDAWYRLRRDGSYGEWRHVVLTHQFTGVHERLIDTNAEVVDVYFTTEDARTDTHRIRLVPPPAVRRAILTVSPPAYASGRAAPLEANLGPGVDERAVTDRPSLVGSDVELVLELNKAMPVPEDARQRSEWLRETLGWPAETALPVFDVQPQQPNRWRLSWSLADSRTLDITLVDEHGLTNREPIRYEIEAIADAPPSVTITEPESDQAVLPEALIRVAGEANDDVAVARLGIEAMVRRGGGEATDPLSFNPMQTVDVATAVIEAELDLATHQLGEGDVVLLTAVASDVYEVDGAPRPSARSQVRRLRIISELDFAAQLRRQLSAVRSNAIRMEAMQSELQDDVIEHSVQPGLDRAQAQIGDRIAEQRRAVDELQAQLDRNRLDDEALTELLGQTRDLLAYAGRAANEAVEAIEQRAEEDAGREDNDEADQPVVEAQQKVRDELGDLIRLLDRDEDTWIVQRQLESMLEEQSSLAGDTGEIARETLGKPREALSDAQLSELERIAQRQLDLRDRSRRLIEEMRRRAEALEEFDPQSASGMRTAADRAEGEQVDQEMEDAAERTQQNRLQNAMASQQNAQRTLQRMLEDMQETRRARVAELIRQLASLIQSIDRLIDAQEAEIIALARAQPLGDYGGRDRAMIRLNQNTQSVAGEARTAGQEARRIARALDRAADAQGAAVTALRAHPVDVPSATEAENHSLELLREARQLAEELQQQKQQEQQDQRREELIEAYRGFAERQIGIHADSVELSTLEALDRRQLVESRRLGNAQQEIRVGLDELAATNQEILDSGIFNYVHERIDEWAAAASEGLWDGRVDVDVTDRQQMIIDALLRQIQALEEEQAPPDEFAREQQGEGGGAGGGSGGGAGALIPPVAELRRVHGLQEEVYRRTRNLDARDDLTDAQRRQRVRELGRMQRDLVDLAETLLKQLQQNVPEPEEHSERIIQ